MDVYLQEIDEKKYSKTDFNETALLGAAHLLEIYDISRLFGSFKTSTFSGCSAKRSHIGIGSVVVVLSVICSKKLRKQYQIKA